MPRGKTKFDRCVKAVSERGGAYDPEAVCGAMRAEGRLNPAVEVRPSTRWKGRWEVAAPGYPIETRKSKRGAISWANGWAKALASSKGGDWRVEVRENPAEAADEAFRRFHGQDPSEYVTVTKQIHYHRHLFSIGDLVELKIRTEDQRAIVTLNEFNGSILAGNEQAFEDLVREGQARATQMFIEGGNQRVNLRDFGIDPDKVHEVETLGKAIKIDYHAVKVHLGSEGGDALYGHKFRTTRQGDKHVKLRVAKYPDVIYRVLDQQLEFSGGSYELTAEGIDR